MKRSSVENRGSKFTAKKFYEICPWIFLADQQKCKKEKNKWKKFLFWAAEIKLDRSMGGFLKISYENLTFILQAGELI